MVDARDSFERAMAELPMVAILRGIRPAEVTAIADAVIDAGFRMLEVPLNSPDPFDSVERLLAHCGDRALIGAGTVLSPGDARRLGDLGAGLLVTPNVDPTVIEAGVDAGLVPLIGAMTPTEALLALRCGAAAVKVFPAGRLGPGYARDLKAVLPPDSRLLAVGGVDASNLGTYRANGYDGFGIGSSLYAPGRSPVEVGAAALELAEGWRAQDGAGT